MKKIILLLFAGMLVAGFFVLRQEEKIEIPKEKNEEEKIEVPEEREREEKEEVIAGKVSIIVDDLGYNPGLDKELAKIDTPLTLAILPFLNHTGEAVNTFKEKENFEIILHLPLEPISEEAHEDRMGMTYMSRSEISSFLDEALDEMKGRVEGLNNHKGSKFTSDSQSMRWLLEEVKAKDLFFVDSRTSGESVGYSLAREMNIPAAERDIFLDVIDDPQEIRERLYELEEKARENGSAIAIGHHKENTIQVLREELPAMKERGIKFVPVSKLLE